MQVLREISQQTADNTSATSGAIGRLADLSALLRKSVSGFRLPEDATKAVPPPKPRKPSKSVQPPRVEPPVRHAGAGG